RRRGRRHRPRQHPAGAGAAAPRGGRRRDPRADLLPAGAVAPPLRHRLRHPSRAHRQRRDPRGAPSLPPRAPPLLHLRRRDDPGRRGAPRASVHRVLHRRLPRPRRGRPGRGRARPRRLPDPPAPDVGAPGHRWSAVTTENRPPISYAAAGVDTAAGDRAVELMKDALRATHGPEVLGGAGGFAGLYDASALRDYRRPLLATSTDGVGTKVAIAQAMDVHDTIGHDLVGMVVDDIVVVGARPLVMTDYIACGKVVPERIADIVRGIAEACALTGTALVGGETAE